MICLRSTPLYGISIEVNSPIHSTNWCEFVLGVRLGFELCRYSNNTHTPKEKNSSVGPTVKIVTKKCVHVTNATQPVITLGIWGPQLASERTSPPTECQH